MTVLNYLTVIRTPDGGNRFVAPVYKEMKMNTCENCSWFQVKTKLPFCIETRANGYNTCNKFYSLPEGFEKETSSPTICSVCKRNKDLGKCWFCGN